MSLNSPEFCDVTLIRILANSATKFCYNVPHKALPNPAQGATLRLMATLHPPKTLRGELWHGGATPPGVCLTFGFNHLHSNSHFNIEAPNEIMLATLNDILPHARENQYAVPAFDCVEDVMVRAILETAETHASPVILMCLKVDLESNGMAYLPGLIRAVGDYHAVPVVLHLDHATELDLVKAAIDRGFTSVMVDGSCLPFEENVRLTRAAVELARPHGVSVEGELGHVGGMDLDASSCAESVLTEPEEVARFVDETDVDALAVSIGTAHGVYKSLPNLAIDRLKELNEASPVPLVLHGGSGTPERQLRQAVRHGIAKLNIYADCRIAMGHGLRQAAAMLAREDPLPAELFGPIKAAVAEVVTDKIRLLSAEGRAGQVGATA